MYIRLFVDCNCIRNRKLKPVPEKYKPYVRFDDNIIYLDYTEGKNHNVSDYDCRNRTREVQPEIFDLLWAEWIENACEHENGFYSFSGTIGPHSRLSPLIRMLDEMPDVGLQNILSAVNCIDNLEIIPEKAADCLIELYQFKSNFPNINGTVVKDEQSGTVLDIHIGDDIKSLYAYENYHIGYDRDGIWATRNGLPAKLSDILFHSCHFQQDVLPYYTSLLVDIASGECLEIRHPVFPMENWSYPMDVTINYRELAPADFSYLTDPFEKAFKASVESGNPVNILCDQTAVDLAF
jgi:hypothetical protein